MPWNVVPFRDDMLPDVVSVYNDVSARLPYHWPVSAGEFLEVVGAGEAEGRVIGPAREVILVAFDGDQALGFAHFEEPFQTKDSGADGLHKTGTVRVLFTRQGCEIVAGTLLHQAMIRLASRGSEQILAWPRTGGYPFYNMNRGGCWSGLNLHESFVSAGFRNLESTSLEGLFATSLPKVRVIGLPTRPTHFEYVVEAERAGSRNIRMHKHVAWMRDEVVGECWWHGLEQLQRHPEACRVAYIMRLKVAPAYQSAGIAKTLILQAFQAMAGRGMRAVALHCRKDGPEAAGRLLESLGFVCLGESFRYIWTP